MNKYEPLKLQLPVQGWKQFLTSRKEMLDAYDSAREKARSHEVETYHGRVAEAEFRKWLSGFLPKRYGVTSGYIVSQGQSSKVKTPHFDVIIYDAIESPVLWVEEDADTSNQGKSLAIPVEHVMGVIEVKSSFNTETVSKAINHLADLEVLMSGLDEPNERYKKYLPPNFFCSIAFFELRKSEEYSEKALLNILSGLNLRGFFQGLILRGGGHSKPVSGKLFMFYSETPHKSHIEKFKMSLLDGFTKTKTIPAEENVHHGIMLSWLEPHFSEFAFNILSIMQGTYQPGIVSSFHGFGAIEMDEYSR